jgi:hypothetical protein
MDSLNPWVDLAFQILALLIPAVVALLLELLRRKIGIERLRQADTEYNRKKDLVETGVLFVQQSFEHLDGPAKYQEALKFTAKQFHANGLKVDEEEIASLIEATVKLLKSEFGEQWKKSLEAN